MNFVSEKDIVRKEGEEEEEYDGRPLYERLKAVRDKKQAEFDEERQLKNQFRGIDDSEADFLGMVDRVKAEHEQKKKQEELELVRAQKAAMSTAAAASTSFSLPKIQAGALKAKGKSGNPPTSTTGVLIRKRKHSDEPDESKKEGGEERKRDHEDGADGGGSGGEKPTGDSHAHPQGIVSQGASYPTAIIRVGSLPGVGVYESSSDDSFDEDESPPEDAKLKAVVSGAESGAKAAATPTAAAKSASNSSLNRAG
ncbi:hypothetical protein M3Y99_00480900 [Aphelenchoides fujianensis]|nr:hypothetical protein M3Y99_00480900 [Aphelenchoides fujianensis]